MSGLPGVNLWPTGTAGADGSTTLAGQSSPTQYMVGRCRVIGYAFEVNNTTAEMFKQGQVTYYRQPSKGSLDQFITYNGAGSTMAVTTTFNSIRMPPANLIEAQLLYGSRTYEAREGAYIVSRLNCVDVPMDQPNNTPNVYTSMDKSIAGSYANPYQILYCDANVLRANPDAGVGAVQLFPQRADKCASFDISGAYFTGLSPTTSLVVNCRWIIERCPTINEPDLVVLATPSACYDPIALELYSHAMCYAPPGVPVSENPFGEWFKKVVSGVADWAPKIGNALSFIPGASIIGNVVGAGAGVVRDVLPGSANTNNITTAQRVLMPKPRPVPRPPKKPRIKKKVVVMSKKVTKKKGK